MSMPMNYEEDGDGQQYHQSCQHADNYRHVKRVLLVRGGYGNFFGKSCYFLIFPHGGLLAFWCVIPLRYIWKKKDCI